MTKVILEKRKFDKFEKMEKKFDTLLEEKEKRHTERIEQTYWPLKTIASYQTAVGLGVFIIFILGCLVLIDIFKLWLYFLI